MRKSRMQSDICKRTTLITRLLCPGPERSGSTWLFNAIRLLYYDAQQPLDPFWISHLTDSHLQDRGAGDLCLLRTCSFPDLLGALVQWPLLHTAS